MAVTDISEEVKEVCLQLQCQIHNIFIDFAALKLINCVEEK